MFDAGLSFQPGANTTGSGQGTGQQTQGQPGGGQAGNPIQQAIRVLSLKFPRFSGQQSPIPGLLAQGPGGAGLGAGMNPYMALLQQLLMQSGASGAPTPSFTPGINPIPSGGTPSPAFPQMPMPEMSNGAPAPTTNGFPGPSPNQPLGGLKGPTTYSKPSFQLWTS